MTSTDGKMGFSSKKKLIICIFVNAIVLLCIFRYVNNKGRSTYLEDNKYNTIRLHVQSREDNTHHNAALDEGVQSREDNTHHNAALDKDMQSREDNTHHNAALDEDVQSREDNKHHNAALDEGVQSRDDNKHHNAALDEDMQSREDNKHHNAALDEDVQSREDNTHHNAPLHGETGKPMVVRGKNLRRNCERDHTDDSITTGNDLRYPLKKRLFRSDKHKLLYCGIEKIGSSFWKRIFKVLNVGSRTGVHLYDMPYDDAHRSIPSSMSMKTLAADNVTTILKTYTSFMFARDPFARLFSGYIDKMLLPNYVGEHFYLIAINNKLRKSMPDRCIYDVSFATMSEFIADAILHHVSIEGHFAPINAHCRPCGMKYTLVGKMETFAEDTDDILSSIGVKLKDVTGEKEEGEGDELNDKGAIADVVHVTFDYIAKSGLMQNCLAKKEIFHRLWRIYQIRGIISKRATFPTFSDIEHLDPENFISAVNKCYDKYKSQLSETKNQRDEALQQAFASLPRKLLQKLSRAFSEDCKLFDYDCNALKRFPEQSNVTFSYFQFM